MAISNGKNRALKRLLRNRHREAAHEPARVEAAPSAPAYSLSASIPERYNDTYVRAIPKDPQSTFVYWEMPREQIAGNDISNKGTAHTGNDEAARIQGVVNGNGGSNGGNGNDGNNGNDRSDGGNVNGVDNGHQRHHANNGGDGVNRWWYAGEETGQVFGGAHRHDSNHGQSVENDQRHDNNRGHDFGSDHRQGDDHGRNVENRQRQDDDHGRNVENHQRYNNNHDNGNNQMRGDNHYCRDDGNHYRQDSKQYGNDLGNRYWYDGGRVIRVDGVNSEICQWLENHYVRQDCRNRNGRRDDRLCLITELIGRSAAGSAYMETPHGERLRATRASMSSGVFYSVGAERPPLSSGVFYSAGSGKPSLSSGMLCKPAAGKRA